MIFLQLFFSFFLIGVFGFGGEYAVLSLIQTQVVVSHHWLTSAQFANIVAVSQLAPGPISLNAAAHSGYTAVQNAGMGVLASAMGGVVSLVAICLPAILLVLFAGRFMRKYARATVTQSVLIGLRPVVVGLAGASALLLFNADNFASLSSNPWQFWISIFIFSFTFIGTMWLKINPIRMIIYAAIAGLVLLY